MTIHNKYNATKLAIAFVVSLMLPVVALAFTEKNPLWVTLAGIFLPLGAYQIFTALWHRSGRQVWAGFVFVFLSAFQLVLLYLFGNSVVATDMFLNLITTNPGEATELLSNIYPAVIVVCVVYIPLLWKASIHLARRVELSDVARRGFVTSGFVSLIVGFVSLSFGSNSMPRRDILLNEIFPINACYNMGLSVAEAYKINNYERTSEDFVYNAVREQAASQREIYVLIIGEASRAANWQLYGYGRKTNPKLAARRDFTLFRGVTTLSNTTHKSVPMLLSSISPYNHDELYKRKGLSALFNEVGFTTYFISNQSPQGAMIDNLAADADHTIYMDAPHYDMQLVEAMNDAIDKDPAQKILFILHSYGSHFSYHQRYPREFAKFLPDDDVSISRKNIEHIRNAYDNSILYTDYFIDNVIGSLEARRGVCSAVLYCADHGEDLMDNNGKRFLHSSPTTTYYQLHIASLAWFSESYSRNFGLKVAAARRNASAAATTHSVFHTMADLASIKSPYVEQSVSLVSDSFDASQERYYVDDHNNAVKLDRRIGIDDSERDLFRRAGVAMP